MPTVTQFARTDRGRATNDMSTNRIKLSIAEKIALLDPNSNPFTLMIQKWSKIAIGSTKRSWITDVYRPEVDQVNADHAGTTTVTIDVDNGTYFAPKDLWRVHDSGEILQITSVATNTLTVVRNWCGATSGEPGYGTALTDNDYLEFIGNSNKEGDTSPVALHTLEVQYDNYTQIQRTPLHLTNTQIQTLMNAEQDLPYEVRKKGVEHARALERQHIFGGKPYTDTTNDWRNAGGLFWFLRKYAGSARALSATTVTETIFLTWLRHCFRYGSGNKVLFAPPLLLEAMSQWAGNHLIMKVQEKMFGIDIQKWLTPHGMVAIVNHKMLEGPAEGGTAYNHAFLLDMPDIKYCYLRGRDTAFLTNRQLPDADAKRQEYLTEATLQIKNFKHHGYMYGFTAYAA